MARGLLWNGFKIMKAELSNKPIWITSAPEITDLDNKNARIIDNSGDAKVNLRVTAADQGPNAGKCLVPAWQSIISGKPQWGYQPRTRVGGTRAQSD